MKVIKAYKFRLYPTGQQEKQLNQHFGCTRFVYNHFLRQRIDTYAETGEGLSCFQQMRDLTQLKKDPKYVWLNEVNSQALQQSLKNLDKAYVNFFKKHGGFPNFKSKHGKQTFKVPQHFKINDSFLSVPKIKDIEIRFSRKIEGDIISVTISRTPTNKYFASFACEVDLPNPEYKGDSIGVDIGLKDFITDSNGIKVKHPKNLKKSLRKLKRVQQRLSRKTKGSSNRNKNRIRLAKIHEKVSNQRKDFLHKLSTKLVIENQEISLEDLNIKGMVRNHKLAQAISDSGWSEFVRQLEYKGDWYGCNIRYLDRWFPSSKRCSNCGWINNQLKLDIREWECPDCNIVHDRDTNAAINIKLFSTVGHTETKRLGRQNKT